MKYVRAMWLFMIALLSITSPLNAQSSADPIDALLDALVEKESSTGRLLDIGITDCATIRVDRLRRLEVSRKILSLGPVAKEPLEKRISQVFIDGSLSNYGAGAPYLLTTYAKLARFDAFEILKQLMQKDHDGIVLEGLEHSAAISLGVTSFLRFPRRHVATIRCDPEWSPIDSIDAYLTALLNKDTPGLLRVLQGVAKETLCPDKMSCIVPSSEYVASREGTRVSAFGVGYILRRKSKEISAYDVGVDEATTSSILEGMSRFEEVEVELVKPDGTSCGIFAVVLVSPDQPPASLPRLRVSDGNVKEFSVAAGACLTRMD